MAGILVGITMMPASPASAASASCGIPEGGYGCSTGYLAASSKIALTTRGTNNYKTVTCRAIDPGGTTRATLSNSSPNATSKNFTVPNNRYFLSCTRTVTTGGGGGALYNTHV
ncbi:hypothetical protein ABT352_09645 [Streptosporangium sp. NPDC000563]|uniref:hypothetical protein n=1 Tax=Streptosporangium sp. NPDC000563 TaxID=3154366 RepID=UPI003334A68D